nr:MAG TPA: hypothetical protein [Inoviridae sp.]DAS55916.1 MAG TPA: hypothetical protein [Inoviridae sp.]
MNTPFLLSLFYCPICKHRSNGDTGLTSYKTA